MAHLSFADDINQPSWGTHQDVSSLFNLSELVSHRCPPIQHYSSQHGAMGKFSSIHKDLDGQLSGRSHHQGLWFLDLGETTATDSILHHSSEDRQQEGSLGEISINHNVYKSSPFMYQENLLYFVQKQ